MLQKTLHLLCIVRCLNKNSNNPVSNKAVTTKIEELEASIQGGGTGGGGLNVVGTKGQFISFDENGTPIAVDGKLIERVEYLPSPDSGGTYGSSPNTP